MKSLKIGHKISVLLGQNDFIFDDACKITFYQQFQKKINKTFNSIFFYKNKTFLMFQGIPRNGRWEIELIKVLDKF